MVMHKFNRIVIDGFKDFDTCDGEGGNIVEMGLYPRVSNFTFLNDHDRCINAGANFFFRLQTWSFVDLELSYPENSIYLNDYSDEVNFLGGVRSGLIIPGLTLWLTMGGFSEKSYHTHLSLTTAILNIITLTLLPHQNIAYMM